MPEEAVEMALAMRAAGAGYVADARLDNPGSAAPAALQRAPAPISSNASRPTGAPWPTTSSSS